MTATNYIKYKGEEIRIHSTCQIDEYYTSDIPELLLGKLMESEAYLRNDSYTVYENMVFFEYEFKDDNNDKYLLYVSYDMDGSTSFEDYRGLLIDESNFRLREL